MAKSVTLPLWVAVILGLAGLWALFDGIVLHGFRAFLKRREEIFLRKIRTRLSLQIPAFKLIRKGRIVDRLMADPRILAAVDESARTRNVPAADVLKKVESYAREIVPSFHAFAYYLLGGFIGAAFVRSLYRVRVGYVDEDSLAEIPPDSSVVFLLNHRSNLDYILLGYLTLGRAPLSFAVGEWARGWPIRPLVTALGAYFVRRGSGDPLYRLVLARYVQMTAEGGLVQAIFPEGRLSRDGSMAVPKVGLLDYLLRGFDPEGARDLIFIPAGVNLDRVFEDRTLLSEGKGGGGGGALRAIRATASFILRNFWLMARGGWRRFGYAAIYFGRPVSMREYVKAGGIDFRALSGAERTGAVDRLARGLMDEVADVVPVLPVSLVSTVFLQNGEGWLEEPEITTRALGLMRDLKARGACVYTPFRGEEYAARFGLRMLALRHFVEKDGDRYRQNADERPILRYYANAIAHLVPSLGSGRPQRSGPAKAP